METIKQKHQLWRDMGVHGDPPDYLLIDPALHTRPDVRLVAPYKEIKREQGWSLG